MVMNDITPYILPLKIIWSIGLIFFAAVLLALSYPLTKGHDRDEPLVRRPLSPGILFGEKLVRDQRIRRAGFHEMGGFHRGSGNIVRLYPA